MRLTGSGLGCSGWPACEKGQIVAPLQTHAVIEFTNRVFSGIVAIGTIAAGLLAFFRVPPRRDLKILGMLLPLGVVAQAVLGGLSVVYDLKPGFVMGHYAPVARPADRRLGALLALEAGVRGGADRARRPGPPDDVGHAPARPARRADGRRRHRGDRRRARTPAARAPATSSTGST